METRTKNLSDLPLWNNLTSNTCPQVIHHSSDRRRRRCNGQGDYLAEWYANIKNILQEGCQNLGISEDDFQKMFTGRDDNKLRSEMFDKLESDWFSPRVKSDKISYVTVADPSPKDWWSRNMFYFSSRLQGIDIKFYQAGRSWVGDSGPMFYPYKFTFMEDAKNINTEYLIFCDAYDVIFQRWNEEELISNFNSYDCDILFNAEANFHPPVTSGKPRSSWKDQKYAEELLRWEAETNLNDKYSIVRGTEKLMPHLNAGVFMCRWSFFRDTFYPRMTEVFIDARGDALGGEDQDLCKILYREMYPRVQIDRGFKMFQHIGYCGFGQHPPQADINVSYIKYQ